MSAHAVTVDAPADLLVEDRDGIRILAMGRGKANAISTEFAVALHGAALAAQEDSAVRFARQLGGASSEVYAAIKRDLRGTAYDKAQDVLPDGRKAFVDSWFSEIGQRGLASALHRSP